MLCFVTGAKPPSIFPLGLEALTEQLGPVGVIRFLQQFETGSGDYTAEREAWLTETDLDILVSKVQRDKTGDRDKGDRT